MSNQELDIMKTVWCLSLEFFFFFFCVACALFLVPFPVPSLQSYLVWLPFYCGLLWLSPAFKSSRSSLLIASLPRAYDCLVFWMSCPSVITVHLLFCLVNSFPVNSVYCVLPSIFVSTVLQIAVSFFVFCGFCYTLYLFVFWFLIAYHNVFVRRAVR